MNFASLGVFALVGVGAFAIVYVLLIWGGGKE